MADTNIKLAPFLTFPGQAEDAMKYYLKVFRDSELAGLVRISDDQGSEEFGMIPGKVLNGLLKIKGQMVMFMDLAPKFASPFSWATSLYIDCENEAEFDGLFTGLSDGGSVMMGPEPVLDLRKVAWVTDRWGVTWQLVWA